MKSGAGEMSVFYTRADKAAHQGAAQSRLVELIRQAKAGDPKALEELILAHQDQVLRLAMHLLGDVEEAKDAAQEVLLRFCKHLGHFDPERKLSPWLCRMVVDVCRDTARKKRARAMASLDAEIESGALAEMPASSDPEAESQRAEHRRIIALALETLSEKERAALVLRDIEGLTTREVAKILGSSETTVRSQISSARAKIKKFRDGFLARRSRGGSAPKG